MAVSEHSVSVIRPDFAFLREVQEQSGQSVSSCYRCLKCTSGCAMAEEMDYPPDRLIRMVQLGLREEALHSQAVWLCSGCLACTERCPNGIDVARVIDTLRQIATAEGLAPGERRIADFHESFLAVVKRYGRLHEASLIALLKLHSRDLFSDLGVGLKMFLKGKIPPLPERINGGSQVAGLIQDSEAHRSHSETGGSR